MSNTEFSPSEITILHTSVERIAGTMTAMIAHFAREGTRELVDLHQLGLEDLVRLRELLSAKGASAKPLAPPPNARNLGPSSVATALRAIPDDPVEQMARVIEGEHAA